MVCIFVVGAFNLVGILMDFMRFAGFLALVRSDGTEKKAMKWKGFVAQPQVLEWMNLTL